VRQILTVALFLGLVAGCEDAPPDRDAAVGIHDLAVWDQAHAGELGDDAGFQDPPDLSGPPPIHGVPCGESICFNEANQYCHTSNWGQSGSCEMPVGPGPGYFACDGPEDCSSAACCYLDSASVCGLYGFCVAGTTVGEFMCHTDVECGVMSKCCRKGSTGTYKTCVDGLGPADPCPVVP
jgi:hypothetical protein